MKKKLVIYGVIYALICILFYASGYFRDEYPEIHIPVYSEVMLWSLVVIVPIATIFILFDVCKAVHKGLFIIIISGSLCLTVSVGCLVNEATSKYTRDYIDSDCIKGISLFSLEECLNNKGEYIVYIGRNDCKECELAEGTIEDALNPLELGIQGYYTNLDRDKSSSKHMYEILDSINVSTVPSIIYKSKNGNIEAVPINKKSIQSFAKKLKE